MIRKITIPENPNEYQEAKERMARVPITNKQIITKVGFGSKKKKYSIDGIYYYLYKVTCSITGCIFISGCASEIDPDLDKHLMPGIPGRKPYEIYKKGKICLKGSVSSYGKENHRREQLLYFDSLSDLLKAEASVVDVDFRTDERTLNYHFHFDYDKIDKFEGYRLNSLVK